VPTIDLPDDELAAVTAAIRRAIEDDKFPHAPRLDPLRAALARLEAAARQKTTADSAVDGKKVYARTKGIASPPPSEVIRSTTARGSQIVEALAPGD
jgi:hypothetical protein